MSYGPHTPAVPRDRHGNPAVPQTAWLDDENSIICAYCAAESDTEDEVPQFRPRTAVTDVGDDERCAQCSCLLSEAR